MVTRWKYWFSLRAYMAFWFYNGHRRVSFGSRLVLQWVRPGCAAPGYSVSSLWPTLERVAGAAQRCPRCSRAPESFQMTVFYLLLFVRVSGYESLGCSRALTYVFSSYARTEEDIIVSRVESGQYAVLERVAGAAQKCSRRSRAPKSFQLIVFQSFS